MAKELAFVLINPYTISKSRTGGIISRISSRTGLEFVAARLFGPSVELVARLAEVVHGVTDVSSADERALLADYVRNNYGPDPKSGRRRRALMLLFEGENAVAKVSQAVGPLRPSTESGETVRDTYGDYILDEAGKVRHLEPAVMIGRTPETVGKVLRLFAEFTEKDGGIIDDATDVPRGDEVQKTLVIIKPDNFRFPSSRPGNIIDIFSASGLRIIGAKVHRMSIAEALQFYGPVQEVLRNKLKGMVADRASKAFSTEFSFTIPDEAKTQIGDILGPLFGDQQFYQIMQFMTGLYAPEVPAADRDKPGKERCLVLIYSGASAVEKIRKILGPTDPSKAEPGSVRKEFGQSIMVNAAHASDSTDNAKREMGIVKPEKDTIKAFVDQYYPA